MGKPCINKTLPQSIYFLCQSVGQTNLCSRYEFDILKDTIAPSLPLPDPSSFEYNFVSAGDTNVYCLQNNLRGENLGILKTLDYTPDSLYVYIYDTTTFHQHSWKEIRQNKLYLDKLVLPKEQYEARMGHPLIVTYQ